MRAGKAALVISIHIGVYRMRFDEDGDLDDDEEDYDDDFDEDEVDEEDDD